MEGHSMCRRNRIMKNRARDISNYVTEGDQPCQCSGMTKQLHLQNFQFPLTGAWVAVSISAASTQAAMASDYGRDANPIVCAQLSSDIAENASATNEPRRNFQLLEAAEKGCVSVAQKLIDQGASVEARNRFANMALHQAAQGGHVAVIKLLLDKGANINQANLAGSTPLLKAVNNNKSKAVEALLAAGASHEAVGGKGVTPLGAAAYNGNDRIVKLLLKHSAKPDEADGTGKGPVVYAAAKGFTSIVQVLFDAGLDPNITYGHSLTALMWAAGHSNDVPPPEGLKAVDLIVKSGAKLDAADDRGRTALMIAAERNHPLIVKFLLEQGADRSARDKAGKSALDLAVAQDVRQLLSQ
jgi:ankyrin repeat protein